MTFENFIVRGGVVYACVSVAYGTHVYWWGVWLYKCMIDVTMCPLVEPEII